MKQSKKQKKLQRKLDKKYAPIRREIVNRSDIYIPLQDPRLVLENAMEYTKTDSAKLEYKEKSLRRSMVNYIRHKETTYNRDLRCMHKRIHPEYREEVYRFIKNASLNMISDEYSYLSDECERQKRKNNMIKIVK